MITPSTRYRIANGPLTGYWFYHADESFIKYIRGEYEPTVQSVLGNILRPGGVLYDVGAHHGFFTLLGAVLVGKTGHVFAFEPIRANRRLIERTLDANRVRHRINVVQAAVCDKHGQEQWLVTVPGKTDMGYLDPTATKGTLVRTVTIDAYLYHQGIRRPPTAIKIDVEGAEDLVLRGAAQTIATHAPFLIVSCHGQLKTDLCSELLRGWGYTIEQTGDVLLCWRAITEDGGTARI